MTSIDINTKMITLLGYPLKQSFAAGMQNRCYEACGLNMLYFYTETGQEHLGDIINGLRYMNFAGFAVTKPNKIKVLEYLDELDPLCEKIGACNTVVKIPAEKIDTSGSAGNVLAETKLVGYNTDGIGFIKALQQDGHIKIDDPSQVYFCIGSGGVGRAICSALAYYGAKKIYITDVYEPAALTLTANINKNFVSHQSIATFCPAGDFSVLKEADIIINASGIGMGGHIGENPLPEHVHHDIRPDQLFFDACYNPEKTQFLLDAKAHGAKILNGLSMSLYQGAEQIRLWTGKEAPIEVLRKALQEISGA